MEGTTAQEVTLIHHCRTRISTRTSMALVAHTTKLIETTRIKISKALGWVIDQQTRTSHTEAVLQLRWAPQTISPIAIDQGMAEMEVAEAVSRAIVHRITGGWLIRTPQHLLLFMRLKPNSRWVAPSVVSIVARTSPDANRTWSMRSSSLLMIIRCSMGNMISLNS